MSYPTIEEILATPIVFDEAIETAIHRWQCENKWGILTVPHKWRALQDLIRAVCRAKGVELPTISLYNKGYMFAARTPEAPPAIYLGPKPSIVSTLHELGHYLYGESELEACRFSIQLFKKYWPKSYVKLKIDGHQMKE